MKNPIKMSINALNIGTPLIINIAPITIFKIRLMAPIAIAKFVGVIESSCVRLSSCDNFTSIPLSLLARTL